MNRPRERLHRPSDHTKENALAFGLPSSHTHPMYPGLTCAPKGGPSNQSNTATGAEKWVPAPVFLIWGSSLDPCRICSVLHGPYRPPNRPAKRQAQWQCPRALVSSDLWFPREPPLAPRELTRGASSQTLRAHQRKCVCIWAAIIPHTPQVPRHGLCTQRRAFKSVKHRRGG